MAATTVVLYLASMYIAAVLLASGLAKGVDMKGFGRILKRQKIIPAPAVGVVSWTIPGVEVALAIVLAFGLAAPFAGLLAFVLFVAFLAISAVLFVQGRGAECGCFGVVFSERIDAATLLRDVGFLGAATTQVVMSIIVSDKPAALYLASGLTAVAISSWVVAGPELARMGRRAARLRARRLAPAIEESEGDDVTFERPGGPRVPTSPGTAAVGRSPGAGMRTGRNEPTR